MPGLPSLPEEKKQNIFITIITTIITITITIASTKRRSTERQASPRQATETLLRLTGLQLLAIHTISVRIHRTRQTLAYLILLTRQALTQKLRNRLFVRRRVL